VQLDAYTQDGGIEVHRQIDLSGEPLDDRVKLFYGEKPSPAKTGDAIQEVNLKLRQLKQDYMDYWNSTAAQTSTGRPVDAVLSPVTATAGLQLHKTANVGKSPCIGQPGAELT
jgi:amidase